MKPSEELWREVIKDELKLEKTINIVIPKLIEFIKKKNVTTVFLLERTARFFKQGLKDCLSQAGLGEVKVLSVAPDYFYLDSANGELASPATESVAKEFRNRVRSKLLGKPYKKSFSDRKMRNRAGFESFVKQNKILLLEEFVQTGFALSSMKEGLLAEGIPDEKVLTASLETFRREGKSFLPEEAPEGTIIFTKQKDGIFENLYKHRYKVFPEDHSSGVKHAIARDKKALSIYKSVQQKVADMCLRSLKN